MDATAHRYLTRRRKKIFLNDVPPLLFIRASLLAHHFRTGCRESYFRGAGLSSCQRRDALVNKFMNCDLPLCGNETIGDLDRCRRVRMKDFHIHIHHSDL